MHRLEVENRKLREAIARHLEVYREQALELIELRIKRETMCRIATELIDEAAL